jgi:hypothetical protein
MLPHNVSPGKNKNLSSRIELGSWAQPQRTESNKHRGCGGGGRRKLLLQIETGGRPKASFLEAILWER